MSFEQTLGSQHSARWRRENKKAWNQVAHHLIGGSMPFLKKKKKKTKLFVGHLPVPGDSANHKHSLCLSTVNLQEVVPQCPPYTGYDSPVWFPCPVNQSFSSLPFCLYYSFLIPYALRSICLCINPWHLLVKLLSLWIPYPLLTSTIL